LVEGSIYQYLTSSQSIHTCKQKHYKQGITTTAAAGSPYQNLHQVINPCHVHHDDEEKGQTPSVYYCC